LSTPPGPESQPGEGSEPYPAGASEPAASAQLGRAWRLWLAAGVRLLQATVNLVEALLGWLPPRLPLGTLLFALGMVLYLFTRLYRLTDFPIYFFGDEAAQAVRRAPAAERIQRPSGIWFPVYIQAAASRWTPLLPMYFHVLSLNLFGKSVFVTRATSALLSLLAGVSVSLALKYGFKARYWWAGILLVGLTPAYFLHSRTAFETAITTAFYGAFVLFYLLYRVRSPNYLYPALVMGAATFYTYSNAQAVMAAAAGLLFFSDLPYHLKQGRRILFALLLALGLALPFILFRLKQPEALGEHLRMINSFVVQPLPLGEKLATYASKYAYGLSPAYWFWPNQHDLQRHRMAGIAHMHTATLPLFLLGLGLSLWRFRSPQHRAVILAGIAAPAGAAMIEIGIPRVLCFIVAANLLVGLGLDWLLGRLGRKAPPRLGAWSVFAILAMGNLLLLRMALVEGPLMFRDYGLYGMQYGARQIFEQVVPEVLQREPQTEVLISSTWANAADNFIQFFIPESDRSRVRMDGVDAYLFRKRPLSRDMLFVMTPAEYNQAVESLKFKEVAIDGLIPYPDGTPGFYLVRMEYAQNVDEVFAREQEARRQLVEAVVVVAGQTWQLRHSQIDMGLPELMFDGDHFSLMRGLEANPFILEIAFPQARPVSALEADFGLVDILLTVSLYPPAGNETGENPVIYTLSRQKVTDPLVHMLFDGAPPLVERVRIEVFNPLSGETANIHIRELALLP
jgi:hypothetical protein